MGEGNETDLDRVKRAIDEALSRQPTPGEASSMACDLILYLNDKEHEFDRLHFTEQD